MSIIEKLNQNTVTVISGNPNGTYLYLAYDLPRCSTTATSGPLVPSGMRACQAARRSRSLHPAIDLA